MGEKGRGGGTGRRDGGEGMGGEGMGGEGMGGEGMGGEGMGGEGMGGEGMGGEGMGGEGMGEKGWGEKGWGEKGWGEKGWGRRDDDSDITSPPQLGFHKTRHLIIVQSHCFPHLHPPLALYTLQHPNQNAAKKKGEDYL